MATSTRNNLLSVLLLLFLFGLNTVAQDSKWQKINSPILLIHSLVVEGKAEILLCNNEESVFTSFNGGTSWDSVYFGGIYKGLSQMTKAPDGTIWLGHAKGILSSADSGKTWTEWGVFNTSLDLYIFDYAFDEERNYSYLLTSYNQVLKSTDSGKTWMHIGPAGAPDIHGLAVDSTGSIYIAESDKIKKSTDFGTSWSTSLHLYNKSFYDVVVIGNEVYGFGMNQFARSFDNGETFHVVDIEDLPYRYSRFQLHVTELRQLYMAAYQYEPTMQYSLPIWNSNDRGEHWHSDTTGLPVMSILDLKTGGDGTLYAATESGLYKTAGTIKPISLSTANLFFEQVPVWETKTDTIIISNITNSILSGEATCSDNHFTLNSTELYLLPGENKTFFVTYLPDSISADEGSINFFIDYIQDTISVYVNGRGSSPRLVSRRGEIEFGRVLLDSTTTQSVQVINTSNNIIVIDSLVTTDLAFTAEASSTTIDPDDSVSISINFMSTSRGSYFDSLFVYTDGLSIISALIKLTGETIKPASMQLEPAFYDFGKVKPGYSKTTSLKITNIGELEDLIITDIISSNGCFTTSQTTGIVRSGDSIKIDIQFKPSEAGIYHDSLFIYSNDLEKPIVLFYVIGKGSQVIDVYPPQNSTFAVDTATIRVKLGLPLDPTTVTNSAIRVIGSHAGVSMSTTVSYNSDSQILTITPDSTFKKCEQVTVTLTSKIKSTSGLEFKPFTWSFKVKPDNSSAIFRLKNTIDIPIYTNEVMTKDFDQDGDEDILLSTQFNNSLVIYENKGNWEFVAKKELYTSSGALDFICGDYDNDGDLDIVSTSITSRLDFFINEGEFNFTKMVLENVPGYITKISQGDYDGDGDLDLIAGSSSSDSKYNIIENLGDLNFAIKEYTGANSSSGINSIDIENDGDIDIVISGKLIENQGGMHFVNAGTISYAETQSFFDPDADGDMDYFTVFSNGFTFFENDGNLIFKPLIFRDYYNNYNGGIVTDFDGNGNEDLVIYSDNSLISFNYHSGPVFTPFAETRLNERVRNCLSTDIDSDGDNDLLCISLTTNALQLFENRNHFSGISLSSSTHDFGSVAIDSSDSVSFFIKNTGSLPLVIDTLISPGTAFTVNPYSGNIQPGDSLNIFVQFTPNAVKSYNESIAIYSNDVEQPIVFFVMKGRAKQNIISNVIPSVNSTIVDPKNITVSFLEGIVSSSLNEETVKVYGDKSGYHKFNLSYDASSQNLMIIPSGKLIAGERVTLTLTNKIQLESGEQNLRTYSLSFNIGANKGYSDFSRTKSIAIGENTEYLYSADLNNDGIADLVAYQSDNLYILISEYGRGPLLSKTISTGGSMYNIVCADFNEDGKTDIAISLYNSFYILKNDGALNFTRIDIPTNSESGLLSTGDFDGDGDIDIVNTSFKNQTVNILVNEGDFSFGIHSYPHEYGHFLGIDSDDIDDDGDIDIICRTESRYSLIILRNDEEMNFSFHYIPSNGYNRALAIADFNHDGRNDIAVDASNGGTAELMLNNGNLEFSSLPQPIFGHWPYCLSVGDFNADGIPDLASVDTYNGGRGFVYINDSLSFNMVSQFSIKTGYYNIINGDYNGDGSIDIAFIGPSQNSIGWVSNEGRKNLTLSTYNILFDSTNVGDSSVTNLIIYNSGKDSLKIDSLYFVNNYFSVEYHPNVVAPSDSIIINIKFTPDSAGHFSDTLEIEANGIDSFNKVVIEGFSVLPTGFENDSQLPLSYNLYQNYPNPFNPTTIINFDLPKKSRVKIVVFDILGKEIALLVDETKDGGRYHVSWNAGKFASGVYFYRIQAGEFNETKKFLLLK